MSAGFSAGTQLPVEINRITVEHAFRRVNALNKAQADGGRAGADVQGKLRAGVRLANEQHPKLMATLDRMAEVMHEMAESQYGRTIRTTSVYAEKPWPQHYTLARECYRLADERKGNAFSPGAFIYAAAAELAGLIS